MDDSLRIDGTRQNTDKRRKLAVNRAAAVGVSVAILAGAMLASALPAGAATPRPTYSNARPTSTPCAIYCFGNVNHR
jgi:hypothetical protein